MKSMTLAEFHTALKAQGTKRRELLVFKCPMCGTLQTGQELIHAGAGLAFDDDVERYVGFSCIGRWTGQRFTEQSKGAGVGCDWTLGGLFQTHKLEVVTPEGKRCPHFEVATPEEAQAHLLAKVLC